MSVEDLMKQRFKVVADYPFSDCVIGEIFTEGRLEKTFFNNLSKYPHLFKRLEWWEERKESDMPEYVKVKETGYVLRYNDCNNNWAVIPATAEEYNNQKIKV